ncbi:acetyl-CoA carboxylase biotin carboxyl carrier protein [Granulicella paludicola]|uniref:acetyl-CoA carboxylase biotin carboxyl carrier protein n=1 Tax=Granulicella paludicola TaxID=474951 RepID=UPI0021DFB92F|nr:acetyl-CoA carboxylase biotin carboxyl carrier protein [Granulicella paludicola]
MDQKDLKELQELVEFLKASGIAEFEMERPDLKVGLKFVGTAAPSSGIDAAQLAALMSASRGSAPAVTPMAAAPVAAAAAPAAPAADPHEGAHIVKSPIVGTFYASPSPDAPAFVQEGDTVSVGKVLCIVEAMKLMNEIESDAAGKIVKVFVTPGQPVEYGQPLFAIK